MPAGALERGEVLAIDRATEIADASPVRATVEWHVDSSNARNGRLGLHMAEFTEEGLLQNAVVFAHA